MRIVEEAFQCSLRDASCWRVDVVKGAAGRRRKGLRVTESMTEAGASDRARA